MGTIESFWKNKVNNLEHGGWKNEKSACKIGRHGDANRNGMARHGMDQLEAVGLLLEPPAQRVPCKSLEEQCFGKHIVPPVAMSRETTLDVMKHTDTTHVIWSSRSNLYLMRDSH